MSVPGYHVGRFSLANGSRAFVALTAMDREVVHVPLVDGTAVLLSVEDPKELVAQLVELEMPASRTGQVTPLSAAG